MQGLCRSDGKVFKGWPIDSAQCTLAGRACVEIQRITDICRAASLKAGGAGIRYTCVIDGKQSHLFSEDNNLWFVEGKAGA